MKNYIQQIILIFTSAPQDEATKREMHRWLIDSDHADEKNKALQELWNSTKGDKDKHIHKSLNTIYSKVGVNTPPRKIFLNVARYAATVAILLISVAVTYYITKETVNSNVTMVEDYTRAGEMKFINLPDGSKVQVNSGTLLLYPEEFTGDTRTIFLQGEANFKVKPDPKKPFIVRSNTMSVTALGTEFNVAAYGEKNEIVATLLKGKVEVICGVGGKNYILKPGQQVSYLKNTGESHLAEVDIEDVTAWQKGLLVFRSLTVQEMLMTLQRKYNITIKYHKDYFNDDKYNFRFSEKATIQEVLAIMKEIVGNFRYSIKGNVCIIK